MLSCVFLSLTRVAVYVGVFVCICTNTRTLHTCGVFNMSPRVVTRHPKDPKNPDGLNLGKYVFVYLYKVHLCIHMLWGGMRVEFLLKNESG